MVLQVGMSVRTRIVWSCAFIIVLGLSTSAKEEPDPIAQLLGAGKFKEATQQLEAATSQAQTVEELTGLYHKLGEIYLNYTHEYPKALKAYDAILQLSDKGLSDEERFLAHIRKGDVYCRLGKHTEAIQTYQTVVDTFPSDHFAHKTALRKVRTLQAALNDFSEQERVIDAHPDTPFAVEAKFQIAELYRNQHQLNQPELAIAVYEDILAQHGDSRLAAEAQWRIGNLQDKALNQPEEAIGAYRKVVENHPTSDFAAEALFQIGRLQKELGRYPQAIQSFKHLMRQWPDFWNMHAVFYWSGVCYEKMSDYRNAIDAFKTFLYVYLPNLDPIYFGAIGKYDQQPEQVQAEVTEKIAQLETSYPAVAWRQISRWIADGNYIEALPLAQQLLRDAPKTEYAQRARAQFREIELRAAIQRIQESEQADSPESRFQIARIYERELKDYRQALAAYQALIEAHPKSSWTAEALYRCSVIYADQLHDTDAAIRLYRTLIKDFPDRSQTIMAHFQLGEIYRSLQRYDDAVKAYQITISFPKQDQYLMGGYKDSFADRAQFRIGRAHHESQRYDEALATFQELVANRPHSPRLAAGYVYIADISQKRGDVKTAQTAYTNAIRLISSSPIQAALILDEAYELGFQSGETAAVRQRLEELRGRVGEKK